MKKTIVIFILTLLAYGAYAQQITGNWYGALNLPNSKLHLIFHITKTGDLYTTTWDSPDQNASDLPTDKTTFTGNQLTIEATRFGIKYTGTLLPDSNKVNGTFIQGLNSLPLVLTATPTEAAPPARPQDPTVFPYKQQQVVFANPKGGNQLAGTLTLPAQGKFTKIVVLISGSGAQNRNEELTPYNHRPFLVWSDWLTRQGIAVLRYDDRGVGQSTGNFATATTADFADDAEAAVSYIQSRPDLKSLSIGLIGHSEGGMAAPMVASRNKAVKFIVLLAGPGIPVADMMLQQNADQLRLSGAPPDAIKLSTATNQKIYDVIQQNPALPTDDLKTRLDTLLRQELSTYPKAYLAGASIDQIVLATLSPVVTPWFRYFIAFKPADYLSKVKCPVLALNGTLDMQVQGTANLQGITQTLRKAGNKNFTAAAMTGQNHLFQQVATGSMQEYGQNTETVNPETLKKVSVWVNGLK